MSKTKALCTVHCILFWVWSFNSTAADHPPQNSDGGHPAQDFLKDREYLISECKRIANEKWNSKIDFDNMDVKLYTEGTYVVVHFFTIPPKGYVVMGGDTAFYFIRKLSGGYEFFKAKFGQ